MFNNTETHKQLFDILDIKVFKTRKLGKLYTEAEVSFHFDQCAGVLIGKRSIRKSFNSIETVSPEKPKMLELLPNIFAHSHISYLYFRINCKVTFPLILYM